MTTHEVLVEARELISDPERWTQGCGSRDVAGRELDATGDASLEGAIHPSAVCWCAGAAIQRVIHSDDPDVIRPIFSFVLEAAGEDGWAIGPWNDRVSHAEVLAAFDKAIEATKGQAA